MQTALAWIIALGPLALLAAGLLSGGPATTQALARSCAAITRPARWASLFALALALVTAIGQTLYGPIHSATIGRSGVGFALFIDALSSTVLLLVAFVGAIVIHFSSRYLDGDARHGRFMRALCLTLSAVLLLIMSGNLLQLVLAWIATSAGLHSLLLFYAERPAAVLAARKKFVISRLGDLCLIAATLLLYRSFGTLDYAALFGTIDAMRGGGASAATLGPVAVLLAAAALLKSAQFPLHGWLLEVMETPTPVSALLHAGVINAGGFLLLRFADVISVSTPALDMLAAIGGLTAMFGSVVMLTQTSVKLSLAYSTIAQMGFMMLQCGLGAFSSAALHLVAHSLYKAHAFLSSGSVIDLARASWSPSPGGAPHPARMALAIGAVLTMTIAASVGFGATLTQQPGVFALAAVVMLGLTHLLASAIDQRGNGYLLARTALLAGAVALAYFALQWSARTLLADALPPTRALRGPLDLAIVLSVVLGFATVTLLQSRVLRPDAAQRWQALYIHVANGFYVNTLANRFALRWWPGQTHLSNPVSGTGARR